MAVREWNNSLFFPETSYINRYFHRVLSFTYLYFEFKKIKWNNKIIVCNKT